MRVQVVDLFCGVGGLTRGLLDSGLNVVGGFDIDGTCKYTYETNNNIQFHQYNIREMTGEEILACYDKDCTKILVGCAPCQPFSKMSFKRFKESPIEDDEKYDLLLEFGRMIEKVQPVIVSMENVPQIRKMEIFPKFIKILKDNGYFVSNNDKCQVVYCPDYGIPQNRRRFVLLASKLGPIELLPPPHKKEEVTVRQFIEKLPSVEAGEECPTDKMHRTAKLSKINLDRIKASKPGGSWKDWPKELRCKCHRKESGQTYTSVYGRMRWDAIGPTITTQFHCYGTGRYGHPEQNRALTLREGALLQTFPADYDFIDPSVNFVMRDIARHIGNAVPVRLGEVIGLSIIQHLNKTKEGRI